MEVTVTRGERVLLLLAVLAIGLWIISIRSEYRYSDPSVTHILGMLNHVATCRACASVGRFTTDAIECHNILDGKRQPCSFLLDTVTGAVLTSARVQSAGSAIHPEFLDLGTQSGVRRIYESLIGYTFLVSNGRVISFRSGRVSPVGGSSPRIVQPISGNPRAGNVAMALLYALLVGGTVLFFLAVVTRGAISTFRQVVRFVLRK